MMYWNGYVANAERDERETAICERMMKAARGARETALWERMICVIARWREMCMRGRTMTYRSGYVAKEERRERGSATTGVDVLL